MHHSTPGDQMIDNGGQSHSESHRSYLLARDGKPFLIINATPERALALVAGFRMHSRSRYDLSPVEA